MHAPISSLAASNTYLSRDDRENTGIIRNIVYMVDMAGTVEEKLKARGYRSHIHHKGVRGHPLSEAKQAVNTRRSKTRARVEHVFGAQAQMGGKLMRGIGLVRATARIGLRNLVYNLQRFVIITRTAPA